MRARILNQQMMPVINECTSVHHVVQCTFTDRGDWYRTDMIGLIADAANDAVDRGGLGEPNPACFDPMTMLRRPPLILWHGRPC